MFAFNFSKNPETEMIFYVSSSKSTICVIPCFSCISRSFDEETHDIIHSLKLSLHHRDNNYRFIWNTQSHPVLIKDVSTTELPLIRTLNVTRKF